MGATEAETENCPECFNNMHSYRMNAESVPSSSGTGPAWGGGDDRIVPFAVRFTITMI